MGHVSRSLSSATGSTVGSLIGRGRSWLTISLDGRRLRRRESPLAFAIAVAGILMLLTLHVLVVRHLGGGPGPEHQLAYPPILLAAYVFGLRGALLAAIIPASVSGPFPILLGPDPTHWPTDGWPLGFRVAMFFIVAAIVGVLFDHLRHALEAVRTSGARVSMREREGMLALARGAEAKDGDTGDHVLRVQVLAERLARGAGLSPEISSGIGFAGLLHDVGKLHVADRILRKPGRLSAEEWEIMQMHTIWGAEILDAGDAYELARRIARWHHENIDGTGYPDRLRGSAIPFEARIVRIADAFDAMTHQRPYQDARTLERAVDELRRCAGRQFDPALVQTLVEILDAEPALGDAIVRPGRIGRRASSTRFASVSAAHR